MAFSLHFSSSSAFLRCLFRQSSHPSCGLPRFLQYPRFFVSIFLVISPFFLSDHVSSPFHPGVIYFANYGSTSSNSSFRSFILLLSALFTPAILLLQLPDSVIIMQHLFLNLRNVRKLFSPYLVNVTSGELRTDTTREFFLKESL